MPLIFSVQRCGIAASAARHNAVKKPLNFHLKAFKNSEHLIPAFALRRKR